jgi:hypothetical protein
MASTGICPPGCSRLQNQSNRSGSGVWRPALSSYSSGAYLDRLDTTSFSIVRFLLGVAEAGFFPGMLLYNSSELSLALRRTCRLRCSMVREIGVVRFLAKRMSIYRVLLRRLN